MPSKKPYYKRKSTEHKKLIKALDNICRDIVLKKYDRCVTCGTRDNPTPGHLITRGAHSVRWDMRNLARQCSGCNFRHEHHPEIYTQWFIHKYGIEAYDELVFDSHKPDLRSNAELEELLGELKATLRTLM